eukprot:1549092-Prymnesium_polylepis.1
MERDVVVFDRSGHGLAQAATAVEECFVVVDIQTSAEQREGRQTAANAKCASISYGCVSDGFSTQGGQVSLR